MWVGGVASLPTLPASSGTCAPILPPATFSNPLSLPPRRAAASTRAYSCSLHSGSGGGNGGGLESPSPFSSLGRGRGGFPVALASSRRRTGKSAPGLVEMDGDEDYDEWEDEDGEEEENGPAVPFDEMRKWLRNKPAGFGEGKSYDTTIEEKLLEEMEQSRKAQLANINKLKSGVADQARPKKQPPQRLDAMEVAPNCARVRIRGLPRKKNIHRDLQLAFKRFPSIINISPAIVGNKKTRDPVCKGFAFVDFNSDEAANNFVQLYSKRSVLFGRVQKEITCDIINTFHPSSPNSEKFGQQGARRRLTDYVDVGVEPTQVSIQDLEEKDSEALNGIVTGCGIEDNLKRIATIDDQPSLPVHTTIDIGYSHDNFLISEETLGLQNGEEGAESASPKQKQKNQMAPRKKSAKTKPDRAPKLSMPGSIARLKVRERAVLTGVLSKYGQQAVPAPSMKG